MSPWLNRRRFARTEVQLPVAYRHRSGGLCWTRSYDVSAAGLKMRAMEPLSTGMPLELTLHVPLPRGEKVFHSEGLVVWCRPEGGQDAPQTCGIMFNQALLDVLEFLD